MKTIGKVVFALLAAVSLAGCTGSDGDSLKMITEATFPPYEFLRGQEIVGIDVEICRAVAEKMGKKFAVENVDFDSVIPSVISGKADIAAAGITVTEDRRKNVDFSDIYAKTEIVLIYKKSAPILTGEACKGKKVGVQGGNTAENIVVERFKQEPERFRSAAEACAALKAGRCDCVLVDVEPARNCVLGEDELAIAPTPVNLEEYAVAVRKGRPELLKAINETIAELKASGKLAEISARFKAEADALKK
ncbi:MAG: ABC transporter substrate-binding protein [Kiritimatiellia bacterium]